MYIHIYTYMTHITFMMRSCQMSREWISMFKLQPTHLNNQEELIGFVKILKDCPNACLLVDSF